MYASQTQSCDFSLHRIHCRACVHVTICIHIHSIHVSWKNPEPNNPTIQRRGISENGGDCRNKHSNTDEAPPKKLVPRVPPNELSKMITFKEEKPMLQKDVQDDDFDGIRIWVFTVVFFVYGKYIYICILICKYVINVMDFWMICFWGTIFVMTNSVNDLPTGSQGRSPKMSILTGLRARCFCLYLNICLKMDEKNFRTSWMACFFLFILFCLVTQEENTFEPHPFD